MTFLKIDWAPNEIFLKLGPLAIHWYSVMFIIAFTLGYYIIKKIYINDNKSIELVEPLFIYTVLGTLIGARLGEVFFYNWEYFQNNLIEILLPIKKDPNSSLLFGIIDGFKFVGYRGLASHGATIGIITSMFIYKYKFKYDSVLWIFSNRGEIYPRHPAQLYEAFGYFLLFILLWYLYWKTDYKNQKGFLFGLFLICLFSIRVLVEFVKESQGGFEDALGILSTGQWLSIPFIIIGFFLMLRSKKST